MKIANRDSDVIISKKKEFTGSNLKGVLEDENYVVYSYSTPIIANINDKWYRNTTKYSVTTTRQINKASSRITYIDVDETELKTLLRKD